MTLVKNLKKAIALLLCIVTAFSVMSLSVSAASVSASLGNEAENSGDYAYWNGSKMVKPTCTIKDEVKWMQKALNYCISNRGLSATKLDEDGSFGPASKKATIAFQKAVNKAIASNKLSISKLDEDGSFGPATIKAMKTVLNNGNSNTLKTTTSSNTVSSNKKIVSPVDGRTITSAFQPYYRQDVSSSWAHSGIDYVSKKESVYAFCDGKVTATGYNNSVGYYIEIKHTVDNKTFYSYYFHLKKDSIKVSKNDNVTAGTVIAKIGNTGASQGAHLHFQITSGSVINSNGSFHVLPRDNSYKNWSEAKQSKVVSRTSSKKITFYNPEIVLTQGLSIITG